MLYEWLRGPRTEIELRTREALFPTASVTTFGDEEAKSAALIYRSISRPRSREADIAIAATAIAHEATLWTLNPADFADIPGLKVVE